jgi:hypothetical protein
MCDGLSAELENRVVFDGVWRGAPARVAAVQNCPSDKRMSRLRVMCDGQVVGSIDRDHGYTGCAAAAFHLADGTVVAFNYVCHQIDEERNPACRVTCDGFWADAGYWVLEYFLDVPRDRLDRVHELPGWRAERPARLIDLGTFPV